MESFVTLNPAYLLPIDNISVSQVIGIYQVLKNH